MLLRLRLNVSLSPRFENQVDQRPQQEANSQQSNRRKDIQQHLTCTHHAFPLLAIAEHRAQGPRNEPVKIS